MASPSTPTHGKYGAIYRLRPNGFNGSGLNDLTFGAYSAASASAYFEIEIDAAGTPDTFRWRENGGIWTSGVAITGAAQELAGTNGTLSITFAATTAHTLADKWATGCLYDEACTESGDEAQITDTDLRILNPNATIAWTDTGGETVLETYHSDRRAKFTGNVTAVTVTGDNAFVPRSALQKVAKAFSWDLSANQPLADATGFQDDWEESKPGQRNAQANINRLYIGDESLFDGINQGEYLYVELFNYDPDDDATGDHFRCWGTFGTLGVSGQKGDIIKEALTFTLYGIPTFVANA